MSCWRYTNRQGRGRKYYCNAYHPDKRSKDAESTKDDSCQELFPWMHWSPFEDLIKIGLVVMKMARMTLKKNSQAEIYLNKATMTTNDGNRDELFEKYRDSVKAAIQYINDNFTSTLYASKVCKISMMSQTNFSNIFKQITNKTFVEYINNRRVAVAVELLEGSCRSISEIAKETGFNNAAYFNKVFKKETGLSPMQYRHSRYKNEQKERK